MPSQAQQRDAGMTADGATEAAAAPTPHPTLPSVAASSSPGTQAAPAPSATPSAATGTDGGSLATVSTVTVASTPWIRLVEAYGAVAPAETVEITAQGGAARLLSYAVVPGQRVAAGDPIADLDAQDAAIALAQAEANLDQARASLDEQLALQRREQALAGVATTAASLETRAFSVTRADAALAQAQAGVDQARLALARARPTAPVGGVVLDTPATLGSLVGNGAILATLAKDGQAAWTGALRAEDATRLRPGHKARVAWNGERWEGVVDRVGPGVDANGLTSVRLLLTPTQGLSPRPEDAPSQRPILLGGTAVAFFEMPDGKGPTVPAQAVVYRSGTPWVAVVDQGTIRFVPVAIQAIGTDTLLVDGLSPGQEVVASGAGFLGEGQNVRVVAP